MPRGTCRRGWPESVRGSVTCGSSRGLEGSDAAGCRRRARVGPTPRARADIDAPIPSACAATSGGCSLKRDEIFERDDWRCVYCGEVFPPEELTLDHVQPRVRGGDRSHGNLVTACKACNTRKGSLRLSAFLHADVAARSHF